MRRKCVWLECLCGLAIWLWGIAHIAYLPPWEGYDETAHFSYAQQIAYGRGFPRLGDSKISAEIEAYAKSAPMPYSTVPPFDLARGWSYASWFGAGGAPERGAAGPAAALPRTFTPGEQLNWQAQHPPAFYILLAPVLKATGGMSVASQLFVLRSLCWTAAFLGGLVSVLAVLRFQKTAGARSALLVSEIVLALWVVLFPGVIPEFARVGNDALVVLLIAGVWSCSLIMLEQRSMKARLFLSACLTLGLLTKITFVPVCFSLAAFWLFARLRKPDVDHWFLIAPLGSFALGGWWYVIGYLQFGSFSGLQDLIAYENGRAIWWHAFLHPAELVKGVGAIALTFVWGGTWSSAYPSSLVFLPVFIAALSMIYFGRARENAPWNSCRAEWLSLIFLGALLASLAYYLVMKIAATSSGVGVPGWYLHVLIGPLSCLFLPRVVRAWQSGLFRFVAGSTASWCVCVLAYLNAMQILLFTGCAKKVGYSNRYVLDDLTCVKSMDVLFDRLDSLAYPAVYLLCLGGVLVAALAAVLTRVHQARKETACVGS